MTPNTLFQVVGLRNFNPHSREGSDNIPIFFYIIFSISIHTPAKGVTYDMFANILYHLHFNPHSREGSDQRTSIRFFPDIISIHTPAKGVTHINKIFPARFIISIHTPAKGVTSVCTHKCLMLYYFNPHSREGSDNDCPVFFFSKSISIHTPAKGVTFQSFSNCWRLEQFQSTLPRRE